MALIPILTITSVAKTDTGSSTILRDDTVYGSPNANRADIATFLAAYKVSLSPLTESALSIETYNVETATQYVVTNSTDGWQKFYFSLIPEYAGGTTYNLHDVVYYPSTQTLYKSISVTPFSGVVPTNTTNWVATSHTALIATLSTSTEPNNVEYTILQTVLTFATTQCLDDLVINDAENGCCDDCGSDPKADAKLKKVRTLEYAMKVASARGMYTQGEKFARDSEKYCDNCSC